MTYTLLELVEAVEVNAEGIHQKRGRFHLDGGHRVPHEVVIPSLAAVGVHLRLFQLTRRSTHYIW